MLAAKLTERINLQQKSVTKNALGEEIVTWADIATGIPAEVRPVRGNEFYAANQMQHTLDLRIFIRERSGVVPEMRLTWKGEPYDITAVIPGTGKFASLIEINAVNGVRYGR